jgi:hypothetical protein
MVFLELNLRLLKQSKMHSKKLALNSLARLRAVLGCGGRINKVFLQNEMALLLLKSDTY